MKNKVIIIDYGLGNLLSLKRAIEAVGYDSKISDSKKEIENAKISILPGVGSFQNGIENIEKKRLRENIINTVKKGNKLLGICLGMQLFFNSSEESRKKIKGLGLIDGKIIDLKKNLKNNDAKVPHIGWASFEKLTFNKKFFLKLNKKDDMYFIHSYYANPKNNNQILATTKFFNISIPSIVKKNNITGFQFHPEKSGPKGLKLLKSYFDENN